MSIRIAFIGMTNSGKTSLIRTILRRPIGEVADRADVTVHSEAIPPKDGEHEDFFATLIDTPGLKEARLFLTYLNSVEKFGQEATDQIFTTDLSLEHRVRESIESSDICIYVVAVDEDVPSDIFFAQMEMCRKFGKKFIVVLNKLKLLANKKDRARLKERISSWRTAAFTQGGAEAVVAYDAHWSTQKEQNILFDTIAQVLPTQRQAEFKKGISLYRERQLLLRDKSIEMAMECIVRCRESDICEYIKLHNKKLGAEYLTAIVHEINTNSNQAMQQFTTSITKLYQLVSEMPVGSLEKLKIKAPMTNSPMTMTAVLATLGVAIFGGIGALVGRLPMVTFGTATAAGSALGGALGAIIGYSGVADEKDQMRAQQAGMVAVYCIDLLWILSCYGWSQGNKISKDIKDVVGQRSQCVAEGMTPINWHTATESVMKDWLERFLTRLDERDLLQLELFKEESNTSSDKEPA